MSLDSITDMSRKLHKACKRLDLAIRIGSEFIEFSARTESDIDDVVSYMLKAGYGLYKPIEFGRGVVSVTFKQNK